MAETSNDVSIKQINGLLNFAEENNISLQWLNKIIKKVVAETGDYIVNRWQEVMAQAILEEYLEKKICSISQAKHGMG